MKRVLLAGNWAWDIYEEALSTGFNDLGWLVTPFRTTAAKGWLSQMPILSRLRPAWTLRRLNRDFVDVVHRVKPNLIFLWRCIDILPASLAEIRSKFPEVVIFLYHNDNPFSGPKERIKNRHYLGGIIHANLTAVFRPANLKDALAWGADRAEILMPSYIRAVHRPLGGGQQNDVIFVGHFEDDCRESAIVALHNAGIDVRILGTKWEAMQRKHQWLAEQEIKQVWGDDYVASLAGAKISLAFLSNKNRDVYTRRCFEIPACGSLLMAPRTKELQRIFKEDEEAVFWSSNEELVEKVRYLLSNESARLSIAEAGRRRVILDAHHEYGRAQQVVKWYQECLDQNS